MDHHIQVSVSVFNNWKKSQMVDVVVSDSTENETESRKLDKYLCLAQKPKTKLWNLKVIVGSIIIG